MTTHFILVLRMLSIKIYLRYSTEHPPPIHCQSLFISPTLVRRKSSLFFLFFPSVRLRDIKLTAACLCCLTDLAHVDHY